MENKHLHTILAVWINLCRFLLAGVFIFSGFVKVNDPYGFAYKIQDYLEAWGLLQITPQFAPYIGSMAMGILEFTLGVYLLFGIHRKAVCTLFFLLMAFMTPLTLWLAIANPISDCGCFGDAVILTNWETFGKNVVLLIAAITVFRWRGTGIKKLVTEKVDWLIALYTVVFALLFSIYCVRELPLFDFRPYYIGMDIKRGMEIPEGEKPTVYETTFIYEKDGVEKEFTIDNFPSDSAWTFVDAETRVKEQGYEPPIQDFHIVLQEDGTDVTEEVLDDDNYTFLLISPQLRNADESGMDLINEVYDYSMEYGYRFLCVTASPDEDIAVWQDNTGAEYPFALADEITLKTIIRSNPGLVLLKGGVILNKWSVNSIPDEYQLHAPLADLPIGTLTVPNTWHKVAGILGWFFGPLLFLTLCDLLWLEWGKKRKKKHAYSPQGTQSTTEE